MQHNKTIGIANVYMYSMVIHTRMYIFSCTILKLGFSGFSQTLLVGIHLDSQLFCKILCLVCIRSNVEFLSSDDTN